MRSIMTDTSLEEIAHLKEVIAILTERLNEREKQLAFYGPAVEPHIVLDKKRVQKELAKARADLRRAQQTRPDEHSPYLGLLTFQESDVYRFFGREEMVEDLVAKVRNRSFLAVLGPSGSGKSSVVHAGLVAALREGALPGST